MSDSRIRDDGATSLQSEVHAAENLGDVGSRGLPAGHALPGGVSDRIPLTDDPGMVRAEIEQTRARMSETIDEIEEALVRKRERIQDRLDVFGRVRERPLAAAGIAFGTGLALGLLTGGSDDEERDIRRDGGDPYWRGRADLWETRARRLLRVAREHEGDARDLRDRFREHFTDEHDGEGYDEEAAAHLGSHAPDEHSWRDGLADFVAETYHSLIGGKARHS
ncbi:MAG: DUF3618 domain-containing protein [Gemmatimonadota bacterium]|nr:DUF3618 domain-containing protein [Gemmatimonadota bacterium]